jgi:hypothetical protein
MAIVQISQIKHRRGLQDDLPQLSSAELGWSVDTQKLYIGNGTLAEGAPEVGNTRILTTADLPFANSTVLGQTLSNNTTSNIALCQFDNTTPGIIFNYVLSRTVTAGNTAVRTGTLKVSQFGNNMSYDDDYTETSFAGVTFDVTQVANTYAQITATTSNNGYDANLKYSFSSVTF